MSIQHEISALTDLKHTATTIDLVKNVRLTAPSNPNGNSDHSAWSNCAGVWI